MKYYLIRTDADPLQMMDCKAIVGGKHYEGMGIHLTKKDIKDLSYGLIPKKVFKFIMEDEKQWLK